MFIFNNFTKLVLAFTIIYRVNTDQKFGSDETPEGAAYIRADIKQIIADQLEALDASGQGILDSASSALDKLWEPFENDMEELGREATVVATDALEVITNFMAKYGAIILCFLIFAVCLIIFPVKCVRRCKHERKIQKIASNVTV